MLSRTASPAAIPLPTALAMLVSAGACRLAQSGPDASIDWSTLSIDSNAIESSWACVSLNPEGWCNGKTVSVSWHTTQAEADEQQARCEKLDVLGSHLVTTADRARAFLQCDGWLEAFV